MVDLREPVEGCKRKKVQRGARLCSGVEGGEPRRAPRLPKKAERRQRSGLGAQLSATHTAFFLVSCSRGLRDAG